MTEESSGSGASASDGSKRNQTLAGGGKSEVAKSGIIQQEKSKRREIRQNRAGSNS